MATSGGEKAECVILGLIGTVDIWNLACITSRREERNDEEEEHYLPVVQL
jgi:hypothetical protein